MAMNNICTTALVYLFCFTNFCNGYAQNSLRKGFKNPPPSAKTQTFWKWLNGNITKEGITDDLEAMKRVGIQEALVFNADMGYPDGPAPYLSDNWLELFKFAASEANRLGLNLRFNNTAGWSASGDPWMTPENAMRTVVFSEPLIQVVSLLKKSYNSLLLA